MSTYQQTKEVIPSKNDIEESEVTDGVSLNAISEAPNSEQQKVSDSNPQSEDSNKEVMISVSSNHNRNSPDR